MKFYLSQIKQLLNLIAKGQIKALLLYGPDKGYIDKICTTIIQEFDLLQTSIEYLDLNAQSLDILLNSQNFFAKRELIKVRSVTASIDKAVKTILSGDFFNFVIFIGDELPPSSSIRKFFETGMHLASIACYYDDEEKITKIILYKCNKYGKVLKEDALAYLKSYLKGDHQLICSEIDKLIYFTHNNNEITINDVKQVISPDLMASGDDLCIYFARKEPNNFLHQLDKLKQQNINEVLIIRALIRYYLNLYIVLSKIENGGCSIDNAIKSLSPPIFYKYVNDFKKIVSNITIKDCMKVLAWLQQAEVDFKLKPHGFDLYQQVYVGVENEAK